MAENDIRLEEAFERLNYLMEELEKPEITLEASFTLYQEGMKLIKVCSDSIDMVEKELIIMNEKDDRNELC